MGCGNIIVIEPEDNFKRINKGIIANTNIDALSLGVYVKVMTLGKSWNFNIKGLAAYLNLSEEKVRKAITLLEQEGYVKRTAERGASRFMGWNYVFYSTPLEESKRSKAGSKGNTDLGKTDNTENRQVCNQTSLNSDNTEMGEENNNKTQLNSKTIIEEETESKRFHAPSVQEVRQYCLERGNTINPEYFVDYYNSNGWMRGNTKIKDWKATIRTWEGKQAQFNSTPGGERETAFQHNMRVLQQHRAKTIEELFESQYGKPEEQ